MYHGRAKRRFNRTAEHRKAMFANMCCALIQHEQIVTTLPKAKDLRPVVEKLVTLAKRGDLHARRMALAQIRQLDLVRKLFAVIGPRYKDRAGGYTRVLEGGVPLRRQCAHGGDRVRGSRRRRQGQHARRRSGRQGGLISLTPASHGSLGWVPGPNLARIDVETVRAGANAFRPFVVKCRRSPRGGHMRLPSAIAPVLLLATVLMAAGGVHSRRAGRGAPGPAKQGRGRPVLRAGRQEGAAGRGQRLCFAHREARPQPACSTIRCSGSSSGTAALRAPGGPTAQSLGSGVIVDPAGLVVTNFHVIENMTDVQVALSDKREFDAAIVLADKHTDLAVLKLKGAAKLPVLELGDSDAIEVGDIVLAVGDPFGVGQTVTQGIVSGLARTQIGSSDYQYFVQTDAAINPGNSGGALVDMNAQADRHQFGDLLAVGRQRRDRLRDSRQHGQERHRGGAERGHAGPPPVARGVAAGRVARHRGRAGARPAGRCAGDRRGRQRTGCGGGAEARRRHHRDRRPDRGRSGCSSAIGWPPSRSAGRRASPCAAAVSQ